MREKAERSSWRVEPPRSANRKGGVRTEGVEGLGEQGRQVVVPVEGEGGEEEVEGVGREGESGLIEDGGVVAEGGGGRGEEAAVGEERGEGGVEGEEGLDAGLAGGEVAGDVETIAAEVSGDRELAGDVLPGGQQGGGVRTQRVGTRGAEGGGRRVRMLTERRSMRRRAISSRRYSYWRGSGRRTRRSR